VVIGDNGVCLLWLLVTAVFVVVVIGDSDVCLLWLLMLVCS